MKKNKLKNFMVALGLLFILIILILTGIYHCPIRFLFGVPCPTCGFSRSIISLFRGQVAASFYYYPVWPVVVVGVVIHVLEELELLKVSRRFNQIGLIIIGVIVIGCFVIRHMNHSPIVEINFEQSLVGRSFAGLLNLGK